MSFVVLLSGGLDSTVLTARLVKSVGAENVDALGVNYGQRHERELRSAVAVAASLGVRYDVIDLAGLGPALASALTSPGASVPHGHYTASNMAATVVPNRNAILLMVAAGVAAARGRAAVATAVHAGDHHVYPDCRPEFIAAASVAASKGTEGIGDVHVVAPFVDRTKASIVRMGELLGAPLDLTWSCYEGGAIHCGRCGTCVERAEAFHLAGVPDPTTYTDSTFWQETTK